MKKEASQIAFVLCYTKGAHGDRHIRCFPSSVFLSKWMSSVIITTFFLEGHRKRKNVTHFSIQEAFHHYFGIPRLEYYSHLIAEETWKAI